jgi:aspartate oxidase
LKEEKAMKTERTSSTMVGSLVLAVASAFIFAGIASAQVCKGQFTLPFDAHWGGATLPAGDYTFTLNSAGQPSIVKIEQGQRNVALVMAQSGTASDTSKASELTVTRSGGHARIRVLHLAELGTDLYYAAPKAEGREMASTRELIQHLPVIFNGK